MSKATAYVAFGSKRYYIADKVTAHEVFFFYSDQNHRSKRGLLYKSAKKIV